MLSVCYSKKYSQFHVTLLEPLRLHERFTVVSFMITTIESKPPLTQNCRQKVFNRGDLQFSWGVLLCGGLDIIKLTKTPHIYSVSRFSLGGLGAFLGGLSPPKPPRGDRTVCSIS